MTETSGVELRTYEKYLCEFCKGEFDKFKGNSYDGIFVCHKCIKLIRTIIMVG